MEFLQFGNFPHYILYFFFGFLIFKYKKARKRKEYLTDYEKYNLQDADFEELHKLLDELEKDVKERKKNEYRKNK